MPKPAPHPRDIEEGLAEIRVRWRLLWFLTIALGVVFTIFAVWALFAERWRQELAATVRALVFSSVVTTLAYLRVLCSRCPACHRSFYLTGPWPVAPAARVFGGRCVHCGLALHLPRPRDGE